MDGTFFRYAGSATLTMMSIHRLLFRAFTVLVLMWSPLVTPAAVLSGCCVEAQVCCVQGAAGSCAQCPSVVKGTVAPSVVSAWGVHSPPNTALAVRLPTALADIWRPPPDDSAV